MVDQEVQEVTETQSLETDAEQPNQEAAKILDLDSVEKFRFAGKEWTPKDFQGAYMMQSDYTRKTQALAEERKYYDNLEADLDRVKQRPELVAQFKSIYPEKFHKFLGYVSAPSQPQENKGNAQTNLPPEVLQRLDRFEKIASSLEQKEVAAIEADLDNKFKALSQKYPYANEEAILARATALHDQGTQLNDKIWDELWKANHTAIKAQVDKLRAEEVKQQKLANQSGRDAGSGGGIPGSPPRQPRTIKEASQFALEELQGA